MKILDYAWNTLVDVSGKDFESVRLVLDENLERPLIGLEKRGYVITLPVPRVDADGRYSLHGLNLNPTEQNWTALCRLFRASLYHAAFHVTHSDMKAYKTFASGKDRNKAAFAISAVEDYRVTILAREKWKKLLEEIAFANYVGALRMRDGSGASGGALAFSSRLLLALWSIGTQPQEESVVAGEARKRLDQPVSGKSVIEAAELLYGSLINKGRLESLPSFPHTETHFRPMTLDSSLVGFDLHEARGAATSLGVSVGEPEELAVEAEDFLQAVGDLKTHRELAERAYAKAVKATRLAGIAFPREDYGAFLRARAELAGSIRAIRDQVMQVKNVLDEERGKESGQIDLQAAMQIVTSKWKRSDAFTRDELLLKNEAWAILIDASRSFFKSSFQIKSVATCLAEVAREVMQDKGKWALYAFNDRLQIIKDFDEEFSIESKARIGGLTQEGPTLLPDAVSAVGTILAAKPVNARYMIVISDCLPVGYSGMERLLKARIKALSKSGILPIGLGIGESRVKRYFTVYAVFNSPYELMKYFTKAYITLSAMT